MNFARGCTRGWNLWGKHGHRASFTRADVQDIWTREGPFSNSLYEFWTIVTVDVCLRLSPARVQTTGRHQHGRIHGFIYMLVSFICRTVNSSLDVSGSIWDACTTTTFNDSPTALNTSRTHPSSPLWGWGTKSIKVATSPCCNLPSGRSSRNVTRWYSSNIWLPTLQRH